MVFPSLPLSLSAGRTCTLCTERFLQEGTASGVQAQRSAQPCWIDLESGPLSVDTACSFPPVQVIQYMLLSSQYLWYI